MKTNVVRYNTVAMALHWVFAVLMIYMLFWGEGLIKGKPWMQPPEAASNPALHAELGILILVLSVARLAWRLMNPPPPDVPMPAWQAKGSHALHMGFYALMILIPLSGMADLPRAIAGRHPDYANLSFFGLFTVPQIPAPWLGNLHDLLGNLAIFLLALHVLAALKHQFIDRDGLISRMLPGSN